MAIARTPELGYIEKMSNYDLYMEYIKIMRAYYKDNPDKILLVLENIDHYLNIEQYFFVDEAIRDYDIRIRYKHNCHNEHKEICIY